MNILLGWIALSVGAAGVLLAVIIGRGSNSRGAWRAALVIALASAALFICTLPTGPLPFHPGLRLGIGILIGGLLGALAGAIFGDSGEESFWHATVRTAGTASAALLGTSLIIILFGDYPQPALGGFLIGAVMAGVIFRLSGFAIDTWALSSCVLGATTLLATFRFATADARFWWAAPCVLMAAAIIGAIASAGRDAERWGLRAMLGSLVTLLLTAVFAWKLFPDFGLLICAITGMVTFALIGWMANSSKASDRAAAICALLVVAFAAMAFKFMAGFGIGLGLLAVWSVLIPAVASRRGDNEAPSSACSISQALYIGVGMLLIRLLLEMYPYELRGIDLKMHYTLVALTLGAIFPFVVASIFPERVRRASFFDFTNATVLGIISAALPLVALAVWGFKALLTFVIGTLVSQIILMVIAPRNASGYLRTAVLITAAQVSAMLLSGLVGDIVNSPRLTRILIASGLTLFVLIWAWISSTQPRPEEEG